MELFVTVSERAHQDLAHNSEALFNSDSIDELVQIHSLEGQGGSDFIYSRVLIKSIG